MTLPRVRPFQRALGSARLSLRTGSGKWQPTRLMIRGSLGLHVALFDRPLSLSCRGTGSVFPLQLYGAIKEDNISPPRTHIEYRNIIAIFQVKS